MALIAGGEISCEIHGGIGLEGKEIDSSDEESSTSWAANLQPRLQLNIS